MIDFSLTDEQQALREMAHDFAANVADPTVVIARETLLPRCAGAPAGAAA